MKGDDRVRFCDLCQLQVYNIANLTRPEATSLISKSEGRICARLYRRADGTVMTKDCPVGWRAIRRRVATIAGAMFATLLSLSPAVFGQKQSSKDKKSCQQQVTITKTTTDSTDEIGTLSGTIVDPLGASIAGATITVTDPKSKQSIESRSDDKGDFRISRLSPGAYTIVIESPGFKTLTAKNISLGAKEAIEVKLILTVGETLMGVIGWSDPIDTPAGTTIIPGNIIRRLPLR